MKKHCLFICILTSFNCNLLILLQTNAQSHELQLTAKPNTHLTGPAGHLRLNYYFKQDYEWQFVINCGIAIDKKVNANRYKRLDTLFFAGTHAGVGLIHKFENISTEQLHFLAGTNIQCLLTLASDNKGRGFSFRPFLEFPFQIRYRSNKSKRLYFTLSYIPTFFPVTPRILGLTAPLSNNFLVHNILLGVLF